ETPGQHLNPQRAVGYAFIAGLPVSIGLEFVTAAVLVAFLTNFMQHYAGIAYRLAVVVLEHNEAQHGSRSLVPVLVPLLRPQRQRHDQQGEQNLPHGTPFYLTADFDHDWNHPVLAGAQPPKPA